MTLLTSGLVLISHEHPNRVMIFVGDKNK